MFENVAKTVWWGINVFIACGNRTDSLDQYKIMAYTNTYHYWLSDNFLTERLKDVSINLYSGVWTLHGNLIEK